MTTLGEQLDRARFGKEAAKVAKIRSGVLSRLIEEPEMTKTTLADELHLSGRDKDLFERILDDLCSEELIDCEKRGKGHYYYLVQPHEDEDLETDLQQDSDAFFSPSANI